MTETVKCAGYGLGFACGNRFSFALAYAFV
jgi:hypothetical protein